MADSSPNGYKNTVGKEEIAHSVFKRLVEQTRKNEGLFWKELIGGFVR